MTNSDFWAQIRAIISVGFTPEGLAKLDEYADRFTCGQLLYQRFSPAEQHGCIEAGYAHIVATLIAGADAGTDSVAEGKDAFKRQCERGETQARNIESWSQKFGCWIDNVEEILTQSLGLQLTEGGEAKVYKSGSALVKSIGLDYYIEPVLALDRISLHNAFFPETKLHVIGFGRNAEGGFRIIVEQDFIEGVEMQDAEIEDFAHRLGFRLINPRNWTYATPEIYLSDMHDENVIRTHAGGIAVIDCDIRINTPELRCGGIRSLTTEVTFVS